MLSGLVTDCRFATRPTNRCPSGCNDGRITRRKGGGGGGVTSLRWGAREDGKGKDRNQAFFYIRTKPRKRLRLGRHATRRPPKVSAVDRGVRVDREATRTTSREARRKPNRNFGAQKRDEAWKPDIIELVLKTSRHRERLSSTPFLTGESYRSVGESWTRLLVLPGMLHARIVVTSSPAYNSITCLHPLLLAFLYATSHSTRQ